MASSEANEIFNAAREFAELMLKTDGEFIPFGVSVSPDGTVSMVAGDIGLEQPPSQEVINLLQSSFIDSLSNSNLLAAGVCLDVRIIPPGQAEKSDAICVRVAHSNGEAMEVYVPYSGSVASGYIYGQVFATAAGEFHYNGL